MANTMLSRSINLLNIFKTKWKFENSLKILPAGLNSLDFQQRYSSFRSSLEVRDLNQYPEVEIVRNPPEWKFVERLLSPKSVPQPKEKDEYPSGWTPSKVWTESNTKYFIGRTKNHMIPVYLHTRYRGQRRLTVIRRIQGDIWNLEKDLRKIVEKNRGRKCASRINEMSGQIAFHGDYVNLIKDYLQQKGF